MDEIRAWLKAKFKDWEIGKTLYLKHGRDLHLKRKLRMQKPSDKLFDLLEKGLEAVLPRMEEVTFRIMTQEEFFSQGYIEEDEHIPTIEERDKIEDLETTNARLYSQRSILSNRLQPTNGEESIRIENAHIIDQIEEIVNTMKKNRDKIRKNRSGVVEEESPEIKGTGQIIIYTRKGNYTLQDLREMNWAELGSLREKVRQQVWRLQKKIKVAAPEKKAELEKEKVIKENAVNIIDDLRKKLNHD